VAFIQHKLSYSLTHCSHRARVARFVNAYPNMEVNYRLDESQTLISGEPITMEVTLSRDVDEADIAADDQIADAPLFPGKKLVNWWLVVGDHSSRALYGIKKVTVRQTLKTKLQFTLPQGSHQLKLYLICDSYTGKPCRSEALACLSYCFDKRCRPLFRYSNADRCGGGGF
jgi:hypothetical protein